MIRRAARPWRGFFISRRVARISLIFRGLAARLLLPEAHDARKIRKREALHRATAAERAQWGQQERHPKEDQEMPKSSPTATAVFTITALVLTNAFALTSAMGLPVGF